MRKVYADASGRILNVTGSIIRDSVVETGGHARDGCGLEREEESLGRPLTPHSEALITKEVR